MILLFRSKNAKETGLTDRFHQGMVRLDIAPGIPAIHTHTYLPALLGPVIVPHIQHHSSIRKLCHSALIDLILGSGPSQLPALSMVIGIDGMGIVFFGVCFNVVAGDQKPSFFGPLY